MAPPLAFASTTSRNTTSKRFIMLTYDNALANLSIEELRKMVVHLQGCNMDDMSHTLLLMKRMSKEGG
jgi:hypothetical protein